MYPIPPSFGRTPDVVQSATTIATPGSYGRSNKFTLRVPSSRWDRAYAAGTRPARIDNIWGGFDHQLTESRVQSAERGRCSKRARTTPRNGNSAATVSGSTEEFGGWQHWCSGGMTAKPQVSTTWPDAETRHRAPLCLPAVFICLGFIRHGCGTCILPGNRSAVDPR